MRGADLGVGSALALGQYKDTLIDARAAMGLSLGTVGFDLGRGGWLVM